MHCVRLLGVRPVWQLKQVKELEQEQEVLQQGLEMMARGRDWYEQQLQRVQERQRRLGQSRASAVSAAPTPGRVPCPAQRPPPPGPGRRAPSSKALQLFFPSGGWTPLRGCPLGPMLLWSTHSSQQHPWVF